MKCAKIVGYYAEEKKKNGWKIFIAYFEYM